MKTNFLFLLVIMNMFSLNLGAQELPFQTIYNSRKAELPLLPEKTIAQTPYCENKSLLLDQAPILSRKKSLNKKADRIVVSKTRKKLFLLNRGRIIREYNVAFGFGYFDGPKVQSGDGRTPEGLFRINLKKTKTSYHRALRVSYPEQADLDFVKPYDLSAGDSVMIHGLVSTEIDFLIPKEVTQIHPKVDWTQGCMAVTNSEIEEIYELVELETPIEICGLENNEPLD